MRNYILMILIIVTDNVLIEQLQVKMLQRALINSDKTASLQKNCYRNGLIISIAVHERSRQK